MQQSLKSQGFYELFPLRKLYGSIGRVLCHEEAPTQPFCVAAVFLIAGIDDQQMNNVSNILIQNNIIQKS